MKNMGRSLGMGNRHNYLDGTTEMPAQHRPCGGMTALGKAEPLLPNTTAIANSAPYELYRPLE